MHFSRTAAAAVLLALSLLACSAVPGFSAPTATEAAPVESAAPPPALAEAQVLNAEYALIAPNGNERTIKFTDGLYTAGGDPVAADFADIHIVAWSGDQRVAFGDLNGDGAEDAAVIIAENYGGTGVFVSVAAVLNDRGQPRHVALYGIDDRPMINAFRIENGTIFVDAVVHGPNDPGCCPMLPVTRTLKLVGEHLMLVGATSKTPDGTERVIAIEAPTDGVTVSGDLDIAGTVTVAPFEQTLGYRFYSEDGSEVDGGPIMVASEELGGPGTFGETIDLAGLSPGVHILIIADFSAADGSVLALDSLEFNIP